MLASNLQRDLLLIDEVKKYECIYRTRPIPNKRVLREEAFKDITQKLHDHGYDISVRDCTERWRSIRDTFNRCRKEVRRSELVSDGVATVTPTWPLWPHLDWYLPYWEHIPVDLDNGIEADGVLEVSMLGDSSAESAVVSITKTPDTPGSASNTTSHIGKVESMPTQGMHLYQPRKRRRIVAKMLPNRDPPETGSGGSINPSLQGFIKAIETRVDALEKANMTAGNRDEHYHFAMQLVPALKTLPMQQCMKVKAQMMALLAEAMPSPDSSSVSKDSV